MGVEGRVGTPNIISNFGSKFRNGKTVYFWSFNVFFFSKWKISFSNQIRDVLLLVLFLLLVGDAHVVGVSELYERFDIFRFTI